MQFRSFLLFSAPIWASAARIARRASKKTIAGVPILGLEEEKALSSFSGDKEWIVMVEPGTSDTVIAEMCAASKGGCKIVGHPKGGVPFVAVVGTASDLESVIEAGHGKAQYVELDGEVTMIPELEAEPEAATWGLNRIGADSRGPTGAGATIYVQDTGVRVSHQDFGGRALPALDVTSGSPVECGGDLSCAGDRQGHGTHCAGTAAGATLGVAPAAAVRSVKTLSDQGSGARSWQYAAIDWVTANGVRPAVISMSLGGSGADPGYTTAIDAAVAAGVTVVVAGGNSNSNACNFSPAFTPNAITVGSTDSNDARSYFSNYGPCTDIWAPGSAVVSALHTSDTGTTSKSGTSMACPHVSGAVALLMEETPGISAGQAVEALLDNAVWDAISDLKSGDTNAFLFVGAGGGGGRPAPTPAPPPGTWELSGSGCELSGNCAQSLNYPSNYGNNQACSIKLGGTVNIAFTSFDTESRYDFLTIGGTSYSGSTSPPDGAYTGTIDWSSDYSVTRSGWKLCKP